MFTIEESWKMSEPEKVVAILKEVGVWRLANWDGCICSRFSIRNVDVKISCGKGQKRGVWVSSPSMTYCSHENWGDGLSLEPIAEEMQRQMQECDLRGPITVHIGERPTATSGQ